MLIFVLFFIILFLLALISLIVINNDGRSNVRSRTLWLFASRTIIVVKAGLKCTTVSVRFCGTNGFFFLFRFIINNVFTSNDKTWSWLFNRFCRFGFRWGFHYLWLFFYLLFRFYWLCFNNRFFWLFTDCRLNFFNLFYHGCLNLFCFLGFIFFFLCLKFFKVRNFIF